MSRSRDRYGVATYSLREIQHQMVSVSTLYLTFSGKRGIAAAGMSLLDALEVEQGLQPQDIYKSMPCLANPDVWQDVYRARWQDRLLYVKFQKAGRYFVISFKDL